MVGSELANAAAKTYWGDWSNTLFTPAISTVLPPGKVRVHVAEATRRRQVGRGALLEGAHVPDDRPRAQSAQPPVCAGVEFPLGERAAVRLTAEIVGALRVDHLGARGQRLRLVEVFQPGQVEEEAEATEVRGQRVANGEVDPRGAERAHILVDVGDEEDATVSSLPHVRTGDEIAVGW